MNYVIKENFGLDSDDWQEYAQWAGLEHCKEYYSIDGTRRESIFIPKSGEDWENCINEDCKTDMLTNLDYAKKIIHKYPNAEIIGVVENPKTNKITVLPRHILMGYDIIDAFGGISLITNWGGKDDEPKDYECNNFGLLNDIDFAYRFKEKLLKEYSEDPHVPNCEVWAVYKVN